jgi:hypothetical protein
MLQTTLCFLYWVLLALTLAAACTGGARAELLLNEILYDPPGADGDAEFVELIAVGVDASFLEGLTLEFCNGSRPGEWETLWTGPAGISLTAGELWLLGEAAVDHADQLVELDLQNGPEAIRLSRDGQVIDLLGYGAELDPSLYEAWPADDVSGSALARRPDGVDTDQNALDWFAAEPSPGALNLPDFRLRLDRVELPWLPLRPGRPCSLSVVLRNTGGRDWPEPPELQLDAYPLGRAPLLAPDHEVELSLELPALPSGVSLMLLTAGWADGQLADSLGLALRVGLGALRMTELLFAPDTGEPEWVECLCLEAQTGLERYLLRDLGGAVAEFSPPALAAGERFLLTADRQALLAIRPQLDPTRLLAPSPWPSLANSGDAAQAPAWTDGLRIDDALGRRVDGLLYRGDWIPARGSSIERLADHGEGGLPPWAACPTGSTPLTGQPDPIFTGISPLALSPNPFDPGRELLWIELKAAGDEAQLLLFDAGGHRVQRLSGTLAPGRLRLPWDGRDARGEPLPDGAYPLLARWTDGEGRLRQLGAVAGLLRRSQP